MRTIYLKHEPEFTQPWYYKIIELKEDETLTLAITEDSVSIDKDEDFFAQVGFVKNKLCNNSSIEITREEFDDAYKKTVEQLNILTSL